MKYFDCQPADRPAGDSQDEDTLKITTEPWECRWKYKNRTCVLSVPAGYYYDGASVPRIAWSISGLWPDGLIRAGALAHDALYRAAGGEKPGSWNGCILYCTDGVTQWNEIVKREEADWVLREFMHFAGMEHRKYNIAHFFVRLGGKKHWGGPMPTIS